MGMNKKTKIYNNILDLALICKRLHDIRNFGVKDKHDEIFMGQFKDMYENFKIKYVDENNVKNFLGDSFDVYLDNVIKSYLDEIYIKSYN